MKRILTSLTAVGALAMGASLQASSHREAPFITSEPKADATDFYMFRSYEPGRQDFVVLIANYLPLQAPFGGPNYYALDESALYEIKIDNDGDAREDVTFQFQFRELRREIALPVGPETNRRMNAVPFINVGPITEGDMGLRTDSSFTM